MRIASNIAASVQQAQARERNDINRNYEKNVEKQQDNTLGRAIDKKQSDRVAQLKEDIKSGNYKVNLAATSEKMAQSLLNV